MAGHPNFWGDAVPQGRHSDREGITFRSSKMTLFNRRNLEHALPTRSAGTSRINWRQIDGERKEGQRLSDLYEKNCLGNQGWRNKGHPRLSICGTEVPRTSHYFSKYILNVSVNNSFVHSLLPSRFDENNVFILISISKAERRGYLVPTPPRLYS